MAGELTLGVVHHMPNHQDSPIIPEDGPCATHQDTEKDNEKAQSTTLSSEREEEEAELTRLKFAFLFGGMLLSLSPPSLSVWDSPEPAGF